MSIYKKSLIIALGLALGIVLLVVLVGINHLSQKRFNSNSEHFRTSPLLTKSPAHFSDVTLISGLNYSHRQHTGMVRDVIDSLGGGACAADFDNDGWIDIVFAAGGGLTRFYGRKSWWQKHDPVVLFQNVNGKFLPVKDDVLPLSGSSTGCATADFNLDGLVDILISTTGADYLFANQGNWQFLPIKEFSQIASPVWTTQISVADINQDGLPDLHLAHYLKYRQNLKNLELSSGFTEQHQSQMDPGKFDGLENQVLINNGDFNFTDQTAQVGLSLNAERTISSSWLDVNGDGLVDLVEYNVADQPLRTYLQTDPGVFEEVVRQDWVMRINNVHFSDLGQQIMDPEPLWLITRGAGLSNIGRFGPEFGSEVSWDLGLTSHEYIYQEQWGAVFSDFNNDGFTDVSIASGGQNRDPFNSQMTVAMPDLCATRQLHNRTAGQSAFQVEACTDSGPTSSRSVVELDYNNDGKQDLLFVANNDALRLLKNTSSDSGSWVTLYQPPGMELQYLHSNGHWLNVSGQRQAMFGNHDPRVHLGLGDLKSVSLRLLKNGRLIKESVLNANQFYQFDGEQWQPVLFSASSSKTAGDDIATYVRASLNLSTTEEWLAEAKLLLNKADEKQLTELAGIFRQYPKYSQLALHMALVDYPNIVVADAAASAIDKLENESSVLYLLKQLDRADTKTYCRTASIFSHWFDEEEAVTQGKYRAVPYLIRGLGSVDNEMVSCSAEALGNAEHINGAFAIMDAFSFAAPETFPTLINALGKIRQREAIPVLLELLKQTGDVSVIQQIFIALIRLDYVPSDELVRQISRQHKTQFWLAMTLLDKAQDGIVISKLHLNNWKAIISDVDPQWSELQNKKEQLLFLKAALLERVSVNADMLIELLSSSEDFPQLADLLVREPNISIDSIPKLLGMRLSIEQLNILALHWRTNADLSDLTEPNSMINALALWDVLNEKQQNQLLELFAQIPPTNIPTTPVKRFLQQCRFSEVSFPPVNVELPSSIAELWDSCDVLIQLRKDNRFVTDAATSGNNDSVSTMHWLGIVMPQLSASDKHRLTSHYLFRTQLPNEAKGRWALTHFRYDSLSNAWLVEQIQAGDSDILNGLLDEQGYDMLTANVSVNDLLQSDIFPEQIKARLQSYQNLSKESM